MNKNFYRKAAVGICTVLMAGLLAGCSRTPGQDSESGAVDNPGRQAGETGLSDTKSGETEPDQADNDNRLPEDTMRIGSLKGPTSLGLLFLQDKAARGEAALDYEFTMVTAADELLVKMVREELDVALIPANVAAILYEKTQGAVEVIDINTLGVLYLVSGDQSITDVSSLKGKNILLTGKGTTPDYVLRYLLTQNGIEEADVTLEYKSEAAEVAALLAEHPDQIGLLPQPFATAACMQNDKLTALVDLNLEWDSVQGEEKSSLVTGVTVVRKAYLEAHEQAVLSFMEEHRDSAEGIGDDTEKGALLAADAGIVAKEAVARKAIPLCNITYIDGREMQSALSGYLKVLYDQNPESVGGSLPGEDFYYTGN